MCGLLRAISILVKWLAVEPKLSYAFYHDPWANLHRSHCGLSKKVKIFHLDISKLNTTSRILIVNTDVTWTRVDA
jgi:hypothetical protein